MLTLLYVVVACVVFAWVFEAVLYVLFGAIGLVAGLVLVIVRDVRDYVEFHRLNPDARAPIRVDPTLRGEAWTRAYREEFARRARERNERRVARERAAREAQRAATASPGS